MVPEIIKRDIEAALESLGGGVTILEKTENSDLLGVAKESEAEFFERIFDARGPFWRAYEELKMGVKPAVRYMYLIGGRMYFCPNVTDRYIYSVGMRKGYELVEGKLEKRRRLTPDNIALLISAPIDTLKHASSTVVAAFRINESLKRFVELSDAAKKEFATDMEDPVRTAEECLEKALECMRFSFYSSIAYVLNIKLAESPAWTECELEGMVELLKAGKIDAAREGYGFYGMNPYAISERRFLEDHTGLRNLANVHVPKNKYIRWRENSKFLAARYLAMRRLAYLKVGKRSGLGDLVFFLRTPELAKAAENRAVAEERERRFEQYKSLELPTQFIFSGGKLVEQDSGETIRGESVSSQNKVKGIAVFVNSRADFSKDLDGKIIVSKTLRPELVEVYDRVRGVVSEAGGRLAHAAVIAREMYLPCIVQTKNIEAIKEGGAIEVDGKEGLITLVQR